MSSNFNNAKIINVYYNKGDRKPYDVNGKPIAYIGQESVGATLATKIRFFLGEQLDSSTAVVVTKRPDGERRLDICTLTTDGANSYYEIELNAWYGAVKGKSTLVFKVYDGDIEFDDEENPTEILSTVGRIIVSDIFNLEIAYAPEADLIVPPDDSLPYEQWFVALSQKLDKSQSIMVKPALPTSEELTGNALDDRYFYVQTNGVGRLYYVDGSTPIEVVFQVGTLKLTATGNGELTADTGKIAWDEGYGGFEYIQYRDVANHIGQDIEYYGKAVGTIAKGDVIQFAGVQGNHYLIKKAVPSEINANPKLIMGIAKQGLTNNEFGYVAHFGRIRGIDTSGYSMGAFLWFSSASINNGELTTTQPTAPNAKILMAVVVDVGNNGTILVRPTIEPSLKELQDVNITSIANGQVLRWNGSNNRWENTSALTTAETDIDALEVRMTTEEGNVDSLESRMTSAEGDIDDIEDGTTIVPKALADQNGNVINTTYLTQSSANATYIPLSQKGANNGVVPLNADGKISSIYLSGEQDDIQEFADLASFPLVGEADILYVAIDTNKLYRWSGSAYVVISETLALGTTNSTAFPGDRGLAVEGVLDTANQTNNRVVTWNSSTGKFDTNGSVALAPQLQASSATFPSLLAEITTTSVDTVRSNINLLATTSGNMSDGFGVQQLFSIRDNANVINFLGDITAIRSGADNSGRLRLGTANAGTLTEKMTVLPNGFVGIGINNPIHKLQVSSSSGFNEVVSEITGTGNAYTSFGLKNTARSYFMGLGANGETSLGLANKWYLFDGTASAVRMVLDTNGNVGIGTTSPNAKLSVSGFAGDGVKLLNAEFLHTVAPNYGVRVAQTWNSVTGVDKRIEFLDNNTIEATIGTIAGAGAGVLTFNTNGAERLRINASGNVGIGTTSPTVISYGREFTISGASIAEPEAFINIQGSRTSDNNIGGLIFHNLVSGTNNNIASIAGRRTDANNSGRLIFNTANAGVGSEKMTILPNGNVGIGTGSPGYRLDVAGGDIRVQNGGNVAGASGAINFNANPGFLPMAQIKGSLGFAGSPSGVGQDQGSLLFLIRNTTGNNEPFTERMIIRYDGNVGIGTGSPGAKLHIFSSGDLADTIIETTSTGNAYAYQSLRTTTKRFDLGLGGNGATGGLANKFYIYDATALATRLVVDTNGLVGINETSPSAQLQVKSGATNRLALVVDTLTSSHTADIALFKANNSDRLVITNTGLIRTRIGVAEFDSNNNAYINTTSTGTTISRNIADTNPALVVNLANASATGNIQVWQKAGSAVANITGAGIFVGQSRPTRTDITANATLALADEGKVLRVNSASNLTITIPLNSSVAFPIDTEIAILRYGTGTVSISPTSGVTLNSKNSERKISGQYGSVALKKIGENEWVLVGSLEA